MLVLLTSGKLPFHSLSFLPCFVPLDTDFHQPGSLVLSWWWALAKGFPQPELAGGKTEELRTHESSCYWTVPCSTPTLVAHHHICFLNSVHIFVTVPITHSSTDLWSFLQSPLWSSCAHEGWTHCQKYVELQWCIRQYSKGL